MDLACSAWWNIMTYLFIWTLSCEKAKPDLRSPAESHIKMYLASGHPLLPSQFGGCTSHTWSVVSLSETLGSSCTMDPWIWWPSLIQQHHSSLHPTPIHQAFPIVPTQCPGIVPCIEEKEFVRIVRIGCPLSNYQLVIRISVCLLFRFLI